MNIQSSQITSRLKDMGHVSGSKFRGDLLKSLANTEFGKTHKLDKLGGISPKEKDRRLQNALIEAGVGKEVEKIYSVNQSQVRSSKRIAADVFKKLGEGAKKPYEKKEILRSVKTFAEASLPEVTTDEPKPEKKKKKTFFSRLFGVKKNPRAGGGSRFAQEKEAQINNNKQDPNNGLQKSAEIHQVMQRLEGDDNENNPSSHIFPFTRVKRDDD